MIYLFFVVTQQQVFIVGSNGPAEQKSAGVFAKLTYTLLVFFAKLNTWSHRSHIVYCPIHHFVPFTALTESDRKQHIAWRHGHCWLFAAPGCWLLLVPAGSWVVRPRCRGQKD